MMQDLNRLGRLLDDARKADKRGQPERVLELLGEIRELAATLAPGKPRRCNYCGMKGDR